MQLSARTRIAKSDHLIYSTPALSVLFFLYYWTQCIDGFSLLLQRYVRKVNDAKKPAILSFLFVTERTQLNAAHAQLLEKLRPIAFAETCGFLTIQSLEFQEIWQKIAQKPREWSIAKKSEFWHREFLIIQNMRWKRFTAYYENRLCQNFIGTVLTEGI